MHEGRGILTRAFGQYRYLGTVLIRATRTNLPIGKDSLMMREIRRVPRPESGPIIVSETSGLPWRGVEFRRKWWRALARAVGIPDDVKNRNSRDAGGDDEEEE
jgi:hypothetical protein